MEYFICHGLWLSLMYWIHILHGMLIRLDSMLKGDINYTMLVLKYVNGGQGGDINVPWKSCPSSLGLGSCVVLVIRSIAI